MQDSNSMHRLGSPVAPFNKGTPQKMGKRVLLGNLAGFESCRLCELSPAHGL